jgi:NitT/TauT family transport system substrate-binding protein
LHHTLNYEKGARPVVKMGYMPVIANLSCPLVDFASRANGPIRFEALKFGSFAEMGEALRNDLIQAAFIIAPLSIVLHRQGADVRIVYIGNRHESTMVYRKDLTVRNFADLAGKSVAVPMRFSGHNLLLRRLAEKAGISASDLKIVEMNPPDMAAALAAGSLDAYFVGEPFAAKTVEAAESKPLFRVEEEWPGFICNLTIVRRRLIDERPAVARSLVQGAARAGLWAQRNLDEAARIAAEYWNQPESLVRYALNTPPNRIVFDRYIPKEREIREIAELMVRFDLISDPDVSGLVDDRFAREADVSGVRVPSDILR